MNIKSLKGGFLDCIKTSTFYVGSDRAIYTKQLLTYVLPITNLIKGITSQSLIFESYESDVITGGTVSGYNDTDGMFSYTFAIEDGVVTSLKRSI